MVVVCTSHQPVTSVYAVSPNFDFKAGYRLMMIRESEYTQRFELSGHARGDDDAHEEARCVRT